MLNANWVDQVFFEKAVMKRYWYIHSIFQKSFNIQDQQNEYLVNITSQEAKVPYGIQLSKKDFLVVKKDLSVGMPVDLQQTVLHFPNDQLGLQSARRYCSNWEDQSRIFNIPLFFELFVQVNKMTGYQEQASNALYSQHPFCLAIDQICQSSFEEQQKGIAFLLGRGMGLTPSGDDMLIGHLFARLVMKSEDQRLLKFIREKIEKIPDITTDVSIHYLKSALQGLFNQSLLEVGKCNEKQIGSQAMLRVIEVGHTSGADVLSGFARSIYRIQENKSGGLLWQREL